MLMLPDIRQDARFLTLLLEAPKSAFEGLAFLDANPRQSNNTPSLWTGM
jgi:hypothetical protein